ncbi:trypsin-like serine peptidase [Streptomyces lichenis]|uniref:Serine protease n=1 Tax=Streptomyces lichenis TaxID=2306967 RepID=A0ABT0IAG4_9ACTN|nr:serine protease [Streptomyces lichenis]MCK8678313.1 serine protease [Streptomyces lichenis]
MKRLIPDLPIFRSRRRRSRCAGTALGAAAAVLALGAGAQPSALADTSGGPAPRTAVSAAPAAPEAPGPEAAGTERALERRIAYGASGRSWRTEIRSPGSSYVKVHFASLKLAGDDYVSVSSPDGREKHTYYADPRRGSDRTEHGHPGFAALSIDGDTAVVTLHATAARQAQRLGRAGYGVVVDRIYRGFDAAEQQAQDRKARSVCGRDARRDVVCYRGSHPTEYARGGAVARQLLNGRGHCTAWRVGNTNRMVTNNHCLGSAADLRASEFQFDYQCATCGGNDPKPGTKVSGADFIRTSSALDYTLFSVNSFDSIRSFGTLYLDARTPQAGERIYIPGHGDAKAKRLSIYEESDGGATCKIDVAVRGEDTGYRCDTSGGNSGSPVLAASSHKVIALHWGGGCPSGTNIGTRIQLVYDQIRGDIDNNG